MRLLVLLIFVVGCGIKNPKCEESHINNVEEYTMQKCMNIFNDEYKCELLSKNRVKELRSNCK